MNFISIKEKANSYLPAMSSFLRDLIRIPGESGQESARIKRIEQEMKKLCFDKITIDPMGNILGYMGSGNTIIAYDAHIDTVGIGIRSNWDFDPYIGYETSTAIGGRGSSDQLGGIVSSIYGARIMKDFGLIPEDTSVLVTGSIQEEDCDGLCWQYIVNVDQIRPEFVVITEPTDGHIYRGQRGRMEIRIDVQGISCHGSAPERGENAIYKMSDILQELRQLNESLPVDPFLGKGTLTVSEIFFSSPSRCAVADHCSISIDRRLTWGETYKDAIHEIETLPSVKKTQAKVSMYSYHRPSYTGVIYPTDCFFPAWILDQNHPVIKTMVESYKGMFGDPLIDKWTFSTNGVAIMGLYQIPCIGFGPGSEAQAHAPNEHTWKADLVRCTAVYALLPSLYQKYK